MYSKDNIRVQQPKPSLDLEYPPIPDNISKWERAKLKFHHLLLVSATHPNTMEYFKSEVAVLEEKKRHFDNFKYTVHPLSQFNQIYEVWCFFFYGMLLFFKTYDFAFIRINLTNPFLSRTGITVTTVVVDVLSLLDIVLQFFIGYTVQRLRYVELDKSKISLRYLTNGLFFCDLFSSIPRVITWNSSSLVFVIILSLTLLKLRRITTFIRLLKPTARFFRIESNTTTFLFGFFFIVALIMHVMTCFHVGIPRFRLTLTLIPLNSSYVTGYLLTLPPSRQYVITFFKSAQYTFLIDIPFLRDHSLPEELGFCFVNYIVGKLLIAVIWIVLLYTFLSQRVLRVKFEEVMTELQEYMLAKQLPVDLKRRLISYYRYKYQNVFFNEVFIRTVLSDNLKREIDVFLRKSLIKQVSIFSQIPARTVKQIVTHLVPEIYLPNDMIIQSATYGDSMYFIESGTVAVFTPSGREICHLNDGAYFGEVSIIMPNQKRSASIIAIETTRTFKLRKEDFDACFEKDDLVYSVLLESAKTRIEETKQVELKHKQLLFEQTFTRPSDSIQEDVDDELV